MDKEIETTLRSLCSRDLDGVFAENSEDAKSKIRMRIWGWVGMNLGHENALLR